ncbi:MAG: mannose-1-phosphate guanylyltransferase [Gemmatimonadota bacterium]
MDSRGRAGAERVDGFAFILAGGIGSRFWPASRPDRPKQLLPLGGPRPLIVDTVERAVELVGLDRTRILSSRELVAPIRRAVPSLTEDHFLLEPPLPGTGPVLTRAAGYAEAREPGSVMVSLHADHVISPLDGFRDTVLRAVDAARAEEGRLYCLGVTPTRPETGYGYVEVGRELAPGAHEVVRFVEKPQLADARAYASSGRHLWNSGIFVWRAAALLEAVRTFSPEMAGGLPALEAGDADGFFARCTAISVDVGVLERADRVGVVRAAFEWDDVGTWAALTRTRELDGEGNAVVGDAATVESRDNIVWSENGRVTLYGVDGLVVVQSGDRTFVTTRERAGDLKRLLAKLEGEEAT